MSKAIMISEIEPLVLRFGPVLKKLSEHEFYDFCRLNDELRIELSSDGDLIVMSPTGGKTGERNFILTGVFYAWVVSDGTGVGFDSSTVFTLPNGAKRSPDVAWVKRSRWEALSAKQQDVFPPLCPDFVIELRSPTDRLKTLQKKMQEYIDNGAQLGWLIDPLARKVYVYRPNTAVECLDQPEVVSGEPLLAGFTMPVARLWQK